MNIYKSFRFSLAKKGARADPKYRLRLLNQILNRLRLPQYWPKQVDRYLEQVNRYIKQVDRYLKQVDRYLKQVDRLL